MLDFVPVLNDRLSSALDLELKKSKTKIRATNGSRVLGLRFHNKQLLVPKTFRNQLKEEIYRFPGIPEDEKRDIYRKLKRCNRIISLAHYIKNNTPSEDNRSEYYIDFHRREKMRLEEKLHDVDDHFAY